MIQDATVTSATLRDGAAERSPGLRSAAPRSISVAPGITGSELRIAAFPTGRRETSGPEPGWRRADLVMRSLKLLAGMSRRDTMTQDRSNPWRDR
jgi:hypothetical protein